MFPVMTDDASSSESTTQQAKNTAQDAAQQAQDKAVEEVTVRGNQVVEKFKEIVDRGNARRVIVKRKGETVMELPLTAGVGGAAAAVALSPTLAALGAFASLATDVKLVIEKKEDAVE
jgi:hypothetical protein